MTLRLVFHPLVADDIQAAYDWYEQQRSGLGADFLDELETMQLAISSNPGKHGFVGNDIRAGMLKRFPYIVDYRVLHDRIRVLAVYHAARDSAGWQSRQ